ncbi:hypothetical protein, partial [Metallibacterium scheffleri]|uniref:hypothetical protein n=1 Tax=Metallibacterium scheffleri TaxID=993689 RepID=UPI0026EEAEAB
MKVLFPMLLAALLLAGATSARGDATQPAGVPRLHYTRMQLANGLTLIVHEDHKAPVVAVSVWYHVGSKNEPAARSGFAHL